MEREIDRVSLVYWTAMAWQYTRHQDVVRVIRFDDIEGYALDPSILVLAVQTKDGKRHAWQFRPVQRQAVLVSRLLGAIVEARPDSGWGTGLLQEVREEIGPLLWGGS
jgi:hypothetical protein